MYRLRRHRTLMRMMWEQSKITFYEDNVPTRYHEFIVFFKHLEMEEREALRKQYGETNNGN